jgi:hypothetical protein
MANQRFRPMGLTVSVPMVTLNRASSFYVYETLKQKTDLNRSACGYDNSLSVVLITFPFKVIKVSSQENSQSLGILTSLKSLIITGKLLSKLLFTFWF